VTCEEGKFRKLAGRELFLDCILKLGVPLDVYKQLGPEALSETERELIKICRTLQCGDIPKIDITLFDKETLNRIDKYIAEVFANDA